MEKSIIDTYGSNIISPTVEPILRSCTSDTVLPSDLEFAFTVMSMSQYRQWTRELRKVLKDTWDDEIKDIMYKIRRRYNRTSTNLKSRAKRISSGDIEDDTLSVTLEKQESSASVESDSNLEISEVVLNRNRIRESLITSLHSSQSEPVTLLERFPDLVRRYTQSI